MFARSTITRKSLAATNEDGLSFYRVERKNYGRSYGRAHRHYGPLNLKADPSYWLQVNNPDHFQKEKEEVAKQLFLEEMSYICNTNKSDLVYITMQWFETTIDPKVYVKYLIEYALVCEEMCEMVSLYFYLICSYTTYGQQIKRVMFNSIKNLFFEILEFQGLSRAVYQPYHERVLETNTNRVNFCIFVNLMFFRMRRDLDIQARYDWLAPVALTGLGVLMQFSFEEMCCEEEKYVGYIKTVTRLAQMNFHYILLLRTDLDDYDCSFRYLLNLPRGFLCSGAVQDHNRRHWLLALCDIVSLGPVLPDHLYNYHKTKLGLEWEKLVEQSNYHRILGPIHDLIRSEYMNKFSVTYDHYENNAFVKVG